MNIFYIKELKNVQEILNEKEIILPKFIKIIWAKLKINLGCINKKNNIIILPINENNPIASKKIVDKMVKLNAIKSVVLCKNLNDNDTLKNSLNAHNIDILDGRYLFRFLILDVVDFVLKKKNKKIQDIELSIMLNELDDINIKTIYAFAKKVKRLNIVTNHIELFSKIEHNLSEEGIMIMISNNKRKSLLKSDFVINLDFVEENLKEYKLNNNCVIVNVSSDIKVYNKGFNGININSYNIDFDARIIENYSLEFDSKLLYESRIYETSDFDKVLDIVKKDNVSISEVIGNKGCAITV